MGTKTQSIFFFFFFFFGGGGGAWKMFSSKKTPTYIVLLGVDCPYVHCPFARGLSIYPGKTIIRIKKQLCDQGNVFQFLLPMIKNFIFSSSFKKHGELFFKGIYCCFETTLELSFCVHCPFSWDGFFLSWTFPPPPPKKKKKKKTVPTITTRFIVENLSKKTCGK